MKKNCIQERNTNSNSYLIYSARKLNGLTSVGARALLGRGAGFLEGRAGRSAVHALEPLDLGELLDIGDDVRPLRVGARGAVEVLGLPQPHHVMEDDVVAATPSARGGVVLGNVLPDTVGPIPVDVVDLQQKSKRGNYLLLWTTWGGYRALGGRRNNNGK